MIVLVGFMGAGKTTVGYMLAEKLGLAFVDIDLIIEQRREQSIKDIFQQDGEPAFRQLEHDTISETLRGPEAVVALGGGAAEHPETRRILTNVTVVHLEVTYEEALLRIGHDVYRPMLAKADVSTLYERRAPIYRQMATLPIETTHRRPETIVLDIITKVATPGWLPQGVKSVLVAPMGGAYQVHVGSHVVQHFAALLPPLPHAERAIVVCEEPEHRAVTVVRDQLALRELEVEVLQVPGEGAKSFQTVERLAYRLSELPAHSDDLIVGLGGEAVCDVAGFLAATYNRGMPLALVPTTLEAQADSSIGGKNAIDLPLGRNLIGTVHQPVLVVSDVDFARDRLDGRFRAGLAEIVKHGMVAEPALLDDLETDAARLLEGDQEILLDLVARSASIKAAIVTADEREQGDRIHLNYGHTFAHAFEQLWAGDSTRRGDGVPLGMMAAAHLAHRAGLIGVGVVDAHRRVLSALGLPTSERFDLDALIEAFKRDKKYRRGFRFVLLDAIGEPRAGVTVSDTALAGAIEDIAH